MKMTSASINKLIKKYQNEIDILRSSEREKSFFVAALNENIEDVRPDFNYIENYYSIEKLEEKIRCLKHHLNLFNITTKILINNKEYTIDEVLILIAQLNTKLTNLLGKVDVPEKRRCGSNGQIIEYRYANFNINFVKKEYDKIYSIINEIQLKLDTINNTLEFEIPDELV